MILFTDAGAWAAALESSGHFAGDFNRRCFGFQCWCGFGNSSPRTARLMVRVQRGRTSWTGSKLVSTIFKIKIKLIQPDWILAHKFLIKSSTFTHKLEDIYFNPFADKILSIIIEICREGSFYFERISISLPIFVKIKKYFIIFFFK